MKKKCMILILVFVYSFMKNQLNNIILAYSLTNLKIKYGRIGVLNMKT